MLLYPPEQVKQKKCVRTQIFYVLGTHARFLVVDEYGETNLIKIEGGTTDKWWDTIQKLVKSFL